ncbi:unnamed protein product [Phytophthora lilii]|uniref:Unnamed protein product n=1 Tax=Phytophthora lilii TaxID=2077276 RepID=A0A9W6WYQ4_9STRA|nr:unnamed protein product [Phytophthora lilii]
MEDERRLGVGETVKLPASLFTPAARRSNKDSVWIRADRDGDAKQRALPKRGGPIHDATNFPVDEIEIVQSGQHLQQQQIHRHQDQHQHQQNHRTHREQHQLHGLGIRKAAHRVPPPVEATAAMLPEKTYDTNNSRTINEDASMKQSPLDSVNDENELSDTENDDRWWQHGRDARDCDFAKKGLHLLIMWRFLQSMKLLDVGFDTDMRFHSLQSTHGIHSQWTQAAAALKVLPCTTAQELEVVLRDILADSCHGRGVPGDRGDVNDRSDAHDSGVATFPSVRVSTTDAFAHDRLSVRVAATVRVTVHLFLCALLSPTTRRLLCSAWEHARHASTKEQLHARFIALCSGLYEHLSDEMTQLRTDMEDHASRNQATSLPALVDDFVGRARLQMRCFQVFMAQTREATLVSVTRSSQTGQRQPHPANGKLPVTSARQRDWNHRWMLIPGSVHIVDVKHGKTRDSRGDLEFVDLVSEFGCVDIDIDGNASCMSLRSAVAFSADPEMQAMSFVLDGRLRVFRLLRSGMSSLVATWSGWSVGDYTAEFTANTLSVDLYGFTEVGMAASVLRGCGQVASNRFVGEVRVVSMDVKHRVMVVCGTVWGATYKPSMFGHDLVPAWDLMAMSSTDRASIWRELQWTLLSEVQVAYATTE